MNYSVIIPARLDSTRLPGKVLLEIGGRPMLQLVHEKAARSGASAVIVATDNDEVYGACQAFGADVRMTSASHPTGTDRLSEVVAGMDVADDHIVVNVQGDEPLIPTALIEQVAGNLARDPRASIATLCQQIDSAQEIFDPNAVKVVFDAEGHALYFSRAPIPWQRDGFADGQREIPAGARFFRHIGLYAYRVGYLRAYSGLKPSPLEQAESLEQLRALHNGHAIHVAEAVEPLPAGVDTLADLERVRKLWQEQIDA